MAPSIGPQEVTVPLGTKLGRYEIRSKIGEGGMGEVYLVEDAQLRRRVALKILPDDLAANQDRMRRFIQEAQAAAALNHPNIAHIYEIGEADGVNFIAMEFIDGLTLRDLIHVKQIDLSKLLRYLQHAAEGLAKAHAAGIAHRDLKPDNIMVTRDGHAKILDFGLAKLIEAQRSPRDGTDPSSEIATAVMQQHSIPGMVMGTVGYMSPEQAQGKTKEIDHRSDIFSFGCILFEAATGKRAFEGKDALDSLHKIVHAPTPQIKDFTASAPDELQRIVRRCLAKEPDKRYQSIREVAIELEELHQELKGAAELEYSSQPASGAATGKFGVRATIHSTSSAEYLFSEIKRHKGRAFLVLGVIGVLVAGLAFGLYKWVGQRPRGGPSQALKISRLTASGKALEAAISPDGKWVVYVQKDGSEQSLWIRQIATNSIIQIVPPAEVRIGRETFSPDGNYVYYFIIEPNSPAGVLYQAPTIGGPPRKVLTNIGSPIAFSPDANRISFIRDDKASTGEDQLIVANADGTGERKLAARKGDKWFSNEGCGWSPDGRVIACPAGKYTKKGVVDFVIAVDAETGEQKEFTSAEFLYVGRVSWLADGGGVVLNAADFPSNFGQLWFISYPRGEAYKITHDLIAYGGTSVTADSMSLVTVQNDATANIWIAPAGDVAHAKQITYAKFEGAVNDGSVLGTNGGVSWTPDGRVVYVSLSSGNLDVWIMNSDGSGQKQLAADPAGDVDPVVSPDGRYIVFASLRRGLPSLWRMDLDGGNLKQLTDQDDSKPQISPDSKWIIFNSWRSPSGRSTLWKISIDGGQSVQVVDKFTSSCGISPDGKLIACFYKDEQVNSPVRIMILPFEGGQPLKMFAAPGTDPISWDAGLAWTPDGRGITYVDSAGGSPNLWSQSLDGGPPKKLTDFKENGVWRYSWSRDGKQLALTRGTIKSDVVLIKDFR